MRLRILVAGLSMASLLPMVSSADILSEDAFWNKDTAYVVPNPAKSEAKALESEEPFAFTSTWDLTLLFASDFCGNVAKGLLLLFK